jgi:hypothetical protein
MSHIRAIANTAIDEVLGAGVPDGGHKPSTPGDSGRTL